MISDFQQAITGLDGLLKLASSDFPTFPTIRLEIVGGVQAKGSIIVRPGVLRMLIDSHANHWRGEQEVSSASKEQS